MRADIRRTDVDRLVFQDIVVLLVQPLHQFIDLFLIDVPSWQDDEAEVQ